MYVGRFLRSSFPSRLRTPQLKAGRFHDRLYELSIHAFTDQKMELDLDDLEGASGGYIVDRGSYGSNGRKPYAVVNDETEFAPSTSAASRTSATRRSCSRSEIFLLGELEKPLRYERSSGWP